MVSNDINKDKLLFADVAKGDSEAFKQLFELYYDPIRINALRLVKSDYWAEEVVQEVFLQVWASKDVLPDIASPASWLYRLCANRSFDRLRKMNTETKAQYLLSNIQEENPGFTQLHPEYDFDQLQKIVKDAISRLPAQQQAVYKLQLEEELSYQEIADRMGLSPNTVRNHLVRAVQSVRGYLMEHAPHFFPLFLLFSRFF